MIYRRCGCRDAAGKQYPTLVDKPSTAQRAKACPQMNDPKHGKWGYSLSGGFDPVHGKRVQFRASTFATKREAQKAETEQRFKLDKGTQIARGSETVSEFLTRWLPGHIRTAHGGAGLRPTSAGQYARVCDVVAESKFGSMRLSNVKRRDVQAYLNGLLESGRGVATAHKAKTVLQAALGAAEDEELVSPGIMSRLRLPRENAPEPETWDDTEMAAFLATAETYRLGAMYDFALETGLRRGELLGLRWSDIDLEGRTLEVRNNRIVAVDGVHENGPKTASSRRDISLSNRSVEILMGWRATQEVERAQWAEAWNNTGHVFTLENGEPVEPNACTRAYTRLVQRAGVGHLRLHGLRHQHASLWIEEGFSEAILSQRLGHSTGTITSRYVHAAKNKAKLADRKGAEAVSARIANAVAVHSLCTQPADYEKTGQTRKVNS